MWNELIHIISFLSEINISADEINKLTYQERFKILNSYPILVAPHFQDRVELFLKEIVLDVPLEKTKYDAIRVEFQSRRSPSIHSFAWVLNCTIFDKRDQK